MFMLGIAVLIIALIATALGFGILAGTAAFIAKAIFVIGLIFFVISLFFKKPSV